MEEGNKSNASSLFCRICHDDTNLVSPCRCSGTVGLVHIHCMEKWLSTNGASTCELCGFEFQLAVRERTISEWLRALKKETEQRRYILCDAISLALLTPLLIFAFTLCVIGSVHYLENDAVSEANSLIVLSFLIVLVYIVWIYLLVSHNCGQYKQWRKENRDVQLMTIKEETV